MSSPANSQNVGDFVNQLLHHHADDDGRLLQFLIEIQGRYGYLPDEALNLLSQRLRHPRAEIESVISFYSFLHRIPARYRIYFSDNITDRMLGSAGLQQRLRDGLTTSKGVEIASTSCTGLCDQGPALLVNGHAIGLLDHQRIDDIIDLIQRQIPLKEWPAELFSVSNSIHRRDRQMQFDAMPGDALRLALDRGGAWLLQQLEASGLRGRGGAGFPTARKWRLCMDTLASDHVVVCNADEGEPGTFKDRVILSTDAHSVIEGMTLCARVIGAKQGFIYLRAEYRFLLPQLQSVLIQRRQQGLLGKSILGQVGFDFDIDIHLGAGAYICGEESALIESLEGKRGIPRVRPPFPVQHGYRGLPTVVNNVETFWSATRIAIKGAEWFKQAGSGQSAGTRLISVSGDCSRPGVYEYPFGTRIDTILEDCGGSPALAVQIAGAAGNLVPADEFARQLSFEDLPTGGSFMVFGPQRNLMDVLQNFAGFFRHESCGFCTSCRNGTRIVDDIMRRFLTGSACHTDLERLQSILHLMQKSSFCGLGCSAPTAFVDALQKLPAIFDGCLALTDNGPCFDVEASLSESSDLLRERGSDHA